MSEAKAGPVMGSTLYARTGIAARQKGAAHRIIGTVVGFNFLRDVAIVRTTTKLGPVDVEIRCSQILREY